MALFNGLLEQAREKKASDIHLTPNASPIFRVAGKLMIQPGDAISEEIIAGWVNDIVSVEMAKTLATTGQIDFSYATEDLGRFRINAYRTMNGTNMAIRALNETIPVFDDLKLPSVLKETIKSVSGLIIVAGPTGSGKSTSLAAMVNEINISLSRHIITIEDPIEYVHNNSLSMINQREVGKDTDSFAGSLRAALRQDPDVILVGEMRDHETISTALTAAETGHLVMTTLHTQSAAQTIDRIIDVFPPHQQQQIRVQLAAVLQAVMIQRLVPRANGNGRVLVTELLILNNASRNLIREGKTHQINSIIQTGGKLGMHLMDQKLKELVQRGDIELAQALEIVQDNDAFLRMAGYHV